MSPTFSFSTCSCSWRCLVRAAWLSTKSVACEFELSTFFKRRSFSICNVCFSSSNKETLEEEEEEEERVNRLNEWKNLAWGFSTVDTNFCKFYSKYISQQLLQAVKIHFSIDTGIPRYFFIICIRFVSSLLTYSRTQFRKPFRYVRVVLFLINNEIRCKLEDFLWHELQFVHT